MHLPRSGLVVAFITPLAFAGPRENGIFRRQGDYVASSAGSSSTTSSVTTAVQSTAPSQTQPYPLSFPPTITSSTSSSASDQATTASVLSSSNAISSSLSATYQTSISSSSSESLSIPTAPGPQSVTQTTLSSLTIGLTQPPTTGFFPYGTGLSSPSGSTVEVYTTDIVYTTLTTCPVTSTIISGSSSIQEVTTTVSTITRTSISTICTSCVAPPRTSPETLPSTARLTEISTSALSIFYSLSRPSTGLLNVSSSSGSSIIGTAISSSIGLGFPTAASLTISATIGSSSSLEIPGYSIVPSPASVSGVSPLSNATTSILPVFTPSLLGNGYGGGFVSTPSLYVTRLSFPHGPSEGVPPGYGFTSRTEMLASTPSGQLQYASTVGNATSIFSGLSLPSSTTIGVGNATYIVGSPVAIPTQHVSTYATPIATTSNGTFQTVVSGISSAPVVSASAQVGGTSSVPASAAASPFATIGNSLQVFVSSAFPSLSGSPVSGQAINSAASPILATSTASNGDVTVETSTPPSSTTSSGLVIVEASTPSPVVISYTASNSQVLVGTSTPLPTLVSSTASNGQEIVEASTPSPILVSPTASSGQEIVETSTPLPIIVSNTGQVITETTPINVGSPSLDEVAFATLGPSLVLISSTASNGEIIVETSPLPASSITAESSAATPIIVSQAASFGQVFVATSTPILASSSAANGNIVVGTPPSATSDITEDNVSRTASVVGTPIEIGAVGSPVSSPEQIAGAPITLPFSSSEEQASTSTQSSPTILTPVVGANGLTSLAAVPFAGEQVSSAGQPAATVLTPIAGANGLTSLAVIPSPIVGANGLTSLAVFSTPIAAANSLSSPAVLLTPMVGANGLTSLAVLATPVVGANGLTSLAVGLAAGQGSSDTPSPIEEYIPYASPIAGSAIQPGLPTSPIVVPPGVSGYPLPSGSSAPSIRSGSSNSSVHFPLSPSAISQYEGSGLKLTSSFGMGLVSFIVLLILL